MDGGSSNNNSSLKNNKTLGDESTHNRKVIEKYSLNQKGDRNGVASSKVVSKSNSNSPPTGN